ncbi:branched-chain amino acid transport system II carrier protein [Corynebacterium sp. TAE3-ERU16]|uniref:branched-chain amino acid transport system II carrier protein n=1 Tax=Corynebacterium sp. TAE3-ERU16 TaxID=2849493 RepID=UPI001C46BCFE|nr:branched-chain amino acid transport system II carrier protein [Corynebacterium sp. TAE3-ERU16]MBV7292229.1 branched-chain amino acid transport system II carrier protein [Corynebacterium sp. TAE3-ERU16]
MSTPASTRSAGATGTIAVATLMLFSMFFGAGNLIFPPMLGVEAGTGFPLAITGFLAAGVLLPVLSVIAVAITGDDIYDLAQRGGKIFGLIFPILVYLAIGAFYALPRTAVVSFSTAVTPLTGLNSTAAAAVFSAIFFALSLALAFDPTGLVDKLGKYLTPILLTLLIVLVALSVLTLQSNPGPATEKYTTHPLSAGLIEGYLTMDSLAALAFGIMVVSSLRYKGVPNGPTLVRGVGTAAIGAGALLGVIYVGLGIVGQRVPDARNYDDGATLLAHAAESTMGFTGMVVFGLIVFLACLSTAAGLIGATSEFFHRIMPGISYRLWAIIFAVISLMVSTMGLETVLAIAAPIIGFLYPAAITLVFLTLIEPIFRRKLHYAFLFSLAVAVIWAALMTTISLGWGASVTRPLIDWAPMHAQQLGWVVPTLIAAGIGYVADLIVRPVRAVPVGGEHQLEAELRRGHRDSEALEEAVITHDPEAIAEVEASDAEEALEALDQRIDAIERERAEATARLEALDEARELAEQHAEDLRGASDS